MESTGKYWTPIFNYLEADMGVCLTHPKYVKAIKGRKTDKKDSKRIPKGLLTATSLTLPDVLSFHQRTSASYANWQDIVLSWSA